MEVNSMSRELKPCGTPAAYERHRVNGETPCQACLSAIAERARKRRAEGPTPRVLNPCGTVAAYLRHKKAKEKACEPCLEANRAYQREKDAARRERARLDAVEREGRERAERRLRALPPVQVPRVVQGPEGVGPCAVAANGYLWDPVRDDETPGQARERQRVAAAICRTACPVFAWCYESAPRVAGVVAGVRS